MITTAEEFVELREKNDIRAVSDEAPESVWNDMISRFPQMKEWVALNKTVPAAVIKRLASDPDTKVRFVVAMKRKCDYETFLKLSNDQDESIRERVIFNPKLPADILEIMKNDTSITIINAIKSRLGDQ